ncbi:MAG: hypothetical protein NT129_01245 [Candidatus Aenigmarchaeota archaeon]|nr:hypothetical protein [Candidatus Aenigmarchaeota archaeon]
MTNQHYENGFKLLEPRKNLVYDTQHPTDELPFYRKELLGLDNMGVLELELAVKRRVFDL